MIIWRKTAPVPDCFENTGNSFEAVVRDTAKKLLSRNPKTCDTVLPGAECPTCGRAIKSNECLGRGRKPMGRFDPAPIASANGPTWVGSGLAALFRVRGNGDGCWQDGRSAVLSLLVDQDRLLPSAWRLIGAVNATCPAARSLLSLQQFVTGPLNATLARHCLFRIIDPANELIPAERREVFP
jgi:hypothetical protein